MDAEPASVFCISYQHAMELIGRRWTGAILSVLLPGPKRFNEILTSVPSLSDRLLSERLRELEAELMLERCVEPGPPVRVAYHLTPKGQELEPVIRDIAAWGQRWLARPVEAESQAS